jgi:site-specific DNA-adenine methylase
MNKKLGIPYMGGKRSLSKPILDYILEYNPKTKYVYDLFGGGGSVSFQTLQYKQIEKVYYNELNTGIFELLKKIQSEGVTDEFYQWIDRETYHKHKNDKDWFGGLIATCWSFGNNQQDYLFSKENETMKKPLHEIIVNKCEDSIKEFYELSGLLVDKDLLRGETINQRRLDVMSFVKKSNIGRFKLKRLQQLEQLEQLQQIERVQQLKQLQQLIISNLSYEDVEITTPIEETIIYLDPPYKNTAKYHHGIDHEKLYEYIRNSPYKIYMSGYDTPFPIVKEFTHICTFAQSLNNKVIERLFCNREEIKPKDVSPFDEWCT